MRPRVRDDVASEACESDERAARRMRADITDAGGSGATMYSAPVRRNRDEGWTHRDERVGPLHCETHHNPVARLLQLNGKRLFLRLLILAGRATNCASPSTSKLSSARSAPRPARTGTVRRYERESHLLERVDNTSCAAIAVRTLVTPQARTVRAAK
jgi:hypothetical protein